MGIQLWDSASVVSLLKAAPEVSGDAKANVGVRDKVETSKTVNRLLLKLFKSFSSNTALCILTFMAEGRLRLKSPREKLRRMEDEPAETGDKRMPSLRHWSLLY
ncbi:hypothetical protein CJP46_09000 [Paenibacillus sp. XY044]|nr:hypothetical protein CJP46_09000 [Paenibacillus sp. XY044]